MWHHSLLLMNGFNKTEAAVFSCRLCFLRAFPFISLIVVFRSRFMINQILIETGPKQLQITIQINNLSKRYPVSVNVKSRSISDPGQSREKSPRDAQRYLKNRTKYLFDKFMYMYIQCNT